MSEMKTENTSQKKHCNHKIFKKLKSVRVCVITLAVVFAVCCLCAAYQLTNSRSLTVTINSDSVSKGQNPDGTAFDIYQILSEEVLTSAVDKLDGRISVDELKQHLSVSDALTSQTNQQLKDSIRDGEYENTYFPTVYRLTYSVMPDKISLEGFAHFFKFLSMDRILQAVAQSYQEYYEESYLTYASMFQIDWDDIDAMDYYNRAEALRTESMRILRFLQDKTDDKRTAVSSSAELTFGDLNNDLWQLIDVDIENHQAYIIQNNITVSRDALLRQFRYMEEIYIEEKERKTEEYQILDDAVDMYDSTTTKVVFIPALDQDNSFYMNRTKVGLDYLVESADKARLAADEAQHNAQYYQYLQTCFDEAVTLEQSQIDHADAVYNNIKGQVEDIVESVKLLLAESNFTENEGIKASKSQTSVGLVAVGLSFAKRFVILSLAAFVLVCAVSALPKKKQTEVQEV